MKRTISFCTLVVLFAASCDPVLVGETAFEPTNQETDEGGADSDIADGNDETTGQDNEESVPDELEEEVSLPMTLYVTGVEYPDGVDWQRDIGYDIADSRLFLMRDGEKVLELPVGYDECVAVDADMHRCMGGHLYTDFSTDDETVVMVDGIEAYRYAGREMIKSLCVHENRIHTLSVLRDGSTGWKYRCDGEEIYSRADCELVGGLYEDDGDLVFTYRVIGSDSYYMFVNSSPSVLSFNSSITEVSDIRRIGGKINYIAMHNDFLEAMEADSVIVTFGGPPTSYEIAIYYDGKDRFYAGTIDNAASVWQESDISIQCNGTIGGFSLHGNDYICVIKNYGNETVSICCNGEVRPLQDGTELMYDSCTATDGISYTVGLINRSKDNVPALWEDGTMTDYGFNGFFTHADYW